MISPSGSWSRRRKRKITKLKNCSKKCQHKQGTTKNRNKFLSRMKTMVLKGTVSKISPLYCASATVVVSKVVVPHSRTWSLTKTMWFRAITKLKLVAVEISMQLPSTTLESLMKMHGPLDWCLSPFWLSSSNSSFSTTFLFQRMSLAMSPTVKKQVIQKCTKTWNMATLEWMLSGLSVLTCSISRLSSSWLKANLWWAMPRNMPQISSTMIGNIPCL